MHSVQDASNNFFSTHAQPNYANIKNELSNLPDTLKQPNKHTSSEALTSPAHGLGNTKYSNRNTNEVLNSGSTVSFAMKKVGSGKSPLIASGSMRRYEEIQEHEPQISDQEQQPSAFEQNS